MYSPPLGGAARRPSVTIDKQQTSNRRFIIFVEDDYLCRPRNSASGGVEPTRPRVVSGGKQTARGRAVSRPSLPVSIHLLTHQVFPRLPLPDQRELIAANQRFCR